LLNKIGKITPGAPGPEAGAPPGQFVTEKFPVLTEGSIPDFNIKDWAFTINGLVDKQVVVDYETFISIGIKTVQSEFHCVTQWSKLQNIWEGVLFKDVMKLVSIASNAKYAMVHCFGDYSINLSLDVLMDDDVLFAVKHDGEYITLEHGAPLRLVVPKRYGWKSAKWVNGIELMDENRPGFWESRGYHMEGDPWKEERFVI